MKMLAARLLQETATGLFFGMDQKPTSTRDRAWLFDEHQILAAVRHHYQSDAGCELVRVLKPTRREFHQWTGRKGGMQRSERKTVAVRKNGAKKYNAALCHPAEAAGGAHGKHSN